MNLHDSPRWLFVRTLGAGGTAEVQLVRLHDSQKEVALKLPRHGTDRSDFLSLAKREHALIGLLRHPGIVQLLETPNNEPPYLLLEYCPGPTLDKAGRMEDLGQALSLISSLAATLEYLHAIGIVHADLKPQNVFLPPGWPSSGLTLSRAKISDFSLGRRLSEPESARAGMGTVGYMAPEVIRSGETSPQSDLFALGVIAYTVLTGRHPYLTGETDPQRINSRILEESAPPIVDSRHDLPKGICELVESLLARSGKDRPRRAVDVCRRLQEAGCAYPYERLLRPKYLLTLGDTFDSFAEHYLSQTEVQKPWLAGISGKDTRTLRLVLGRNFSDHSLQYANGRFASQHLLAWPARLRRRWLNQFSSLSLAQKKIHVRLAVLSECSPEEYREIIGSRPERFPEHAGYAMLLTLLRISTVKRWSARYAKIAEQRGLNANAAILYLQAGDLNKAERCAYDASFELRKSHESARAVSLLKRVIDFAWTSGRVCEVRSLLMALGDTQKDNGEIEQAFVVYQRIVELYKDLPPDKLLAETFKDLGDLYKFKQDFGSGLKALGEALRIYTELGDELEISHTHNNLGNMHWVNADIKQALKEYRIALHIQRRLDVRQDVASTLSNLGSVYCLLGRYRRGTHLLNMSLEIKKEIGNLGEIARSLNNLGYVSHLSGESSRAVDLLKEALTMNQRIGSKKEMLYNLENLTFVMLQAGQLSESLMHLAQGIQLSEELSDQPHIGVFTIHKAIAFMRMGRFGEAANALCVVDETCHAIEDKVLRAQHRLQLACLRNFLGDKSGSLRESLEALSLAENCQSAFEQLSALLHLVRLSEDDAYYAKARRVMAELHMERVIPQLEFNRIEFLLEAGDVPQARAKLSAILRPGSDLPDDIEQPRMNLLIAELLVRDGDLPRAEQHLQDAKRKAEATRLLPELANCQTLQGRLAAQSREYEAAFGFYQRALKHFKTMAASIPDAKDRELFQSTRTIQFLANEIRTLTQRLGNKQLVRV